MAIYVTSAATGSTFIWLPGGLHFIPGLPTPITATGGVMPTAVPAAEENLTPPVALAPWNCTKENPRPAWHTGEHHSDNMVHLGWSSYNDGTPAEMIECPWCRRLEKREVAW